MGDAHCISPDGGCAAEGPCTRRGHRRRRDARRERGKYGFSETRGQGSLAFLCRRRRRMRSDGGTSAGPAGISNGGSGGAVNPAVTLSVDVAPVLQENCAVSGCHDGVTKEHGLDFSTSATAFQSLVNQTTWDHCRDNMTVTRVMPGRSSESFLLVMIEGMDRCPLQPRMPPAPRSALFSEQVEAIRSWIASGAKND